MRERGLKHLLSNNAGLLCKSLPMRERGLKQYAAAVGSAFGYVAPHAGAWIETT